MRVSNLTPIFVYGSLKRGFRLDPYLSNYPIANVGRVRGAAIYDLGWFPGLRFVTDQQSSVEGEVYYVDDHTLRVLDRVEGAPSLYTRTSVTVHVDGDSQMLEGVDTYVYNGDVSEQMLVEDGVWRSR